MTLRIAALATVFALGLAGGAQAAVCGGEPPAEALEFRGPVLEVIDGERLCVALDPDPSTWVAVRLAPTTMKASTAPPPRGALMAASFGQDVTCRIVARDADGVVAECRTDAGSVSRLARERRVIKAGQTWR